MELKARPPDAHAIASLRAITYRITSTPPQSLPAVAAQVSASIWNCKDVLSSNPENAKSASEATTIVNRFRTTLTSLLQDRTVHGRWSAVVLTKAAIEAGGLPILTKSNGWVKSLIAILKRHSDPTTTRQLATILLTRIFQLTWPHQELVREITTPALPAFIAACLANAQRDGCGSAELEAVLEAFCLLVSRHPTVFRTHEVQIRAFVVRMLSSTSTSDANISKSHQQCAARLLVLLHHCAPKQGGADSWTASWTSAIEAAHQTCDTLFRAVIEDPQPDDHQRPREASSFGEVGSNGADTILQPWTGIFAGSERLTTLLKILKMYLETSFTGAISIRVGLLVHLLSRILTLTLEAEADASRFNHQIPKDEREALFCVLPGIHEAALELVASLLRRFGEASMPCAQMLLELTLMVFRAESSNTSLRSAAYTAVNLLLEVMGPSLTRPEVADLGLVIETCCTDLNPIASNNTQASASTLHPTTTHNSRFSTTLSGLQQAASILLPTFITKINPTAMPNKPRILIERTAIAARHKDALVACVLNPMTKATGKMDASLLPILAKMFPAEAEVEALLRPRMPVIVSRGNEGGGEEVELEDGRPEMVMQEVEGYDGHSYGWDAHDMNGAAMAGGVQEELYSLTPPRDQTANTMLNVDLVGHSHRHSTNGTKRPADTEDAELSKRARVSPVRTAAPSAVDDTTQLELGTDSGYEVRDVPMPPPDAGLAAGNVGATGRMPADTHPAAVLLQENEGASDDSDFEMPPLTLEADTESEEEEEE